MDPKNNWLILLKHIKTNTEKVLNFIADSNLKQFSKKEAIKTYVLLKIIVNLLTQKNQSINVQKISF